MDPSQMSSPPPCTLESLVTLRRWSAEQRISKRKKPNPVKKEKLTPATAEASNAIKLAE
jgi:hypothetical protein